MKTANYSYDLLTDTLTITASFHKKSMVYDSPEFKILRKLLTDNAGCKVEVVADTKKTYKGLTLVLIREYIKIQKNADVLNAEMDAVKAKALEGKEDISEKMADKIAYPLIKKWFLKKFKEFSVSRAEKEISDYKIKCAEDSVAQKGETKKGEITHLNQSQMAIASNQ